ncbi:hypothetical protein FRC03_009006 [Tulasnella sp. 419]|nr:hypothetical protein FRC03_009006 [Tulasnella sp. 419]
MSSPEPSASKREHPEPMYARARKRTKDQKSDTECWRDRVRQHGKTFARNVDMFARLDLIVNEGVSELLGENDDERHPPTPAERKHREECLRLYECLKRIYSTLEEDIAMEVAGKQTKELIKSELQWGQQNARASDVSTVKGGLPSYHDFSECILTLQKTRRGYNHNETGRLLCPVHLSWDNLEHVKRLKQGLEDTTPDVFYHFMYEGNQGHVQTAFKGLFRGPILVKAYRAVFFGPSSVNSNATSDTRATRAGNAVLGCITSVSPSAIAYITTLVRFALSSELTFTAGDKMKYSHGGLFRAMLQVMQPTNPTPFRKKFTEELLAWWNAQCFPYVEQPTTGHSATSTVALLLQQEAMEAENLEKGSMTSDEGSTTEED